MGSLGNLGNPGNPTQLLRRAKERERGPRWGRRTKDGQKSAQHIPPWHSLARKTVFSARKNSSAETRQVAYFNDFGKRSAGSFFRLEVQAWAKDWTNNILPPCVNLPLIGNYGWMNVCLRIIMLGENHNMLFEASFARCFPFDYLNDSHSRYNFIHIGYSVLASFVFSSPIGQIENQALFKLTVTLNTNCSSLEPNWLLRKHFFNKTKNRDVDPLGKTCSVNEI